MATLTPDGKKIELKYLFEATFKDGTIIEQNADDVSAIDATRSCFFDVMQAIESGKELVKFTLNGMGMNNDHVYSIDLTDGHFEIDGVSFKAHEKDLENFRVLYFRVRDSHFSQEMVYKGHEVAYRIGFQANEKITGLNEERYIEIK